jgi:hypothetical protein
MFIVIRNLSRAMGNGVSALLLGSVILWQVAEYSGYRDGVAYIHVPVPEEHVMVDDMRYRVETLWDSPIVCKLRPGGHTLRVFRTGRLVSEQEFTVDSGQHVVLTVGEGRSAAVTTN